MSDTNNRPNADGSIRGDTSDLPMRGSMTNVTDTYGADLGQSATNRMGKLTGTQSDSPEDCYADDPSGLGGKDRDDY